MTVQMFTLALEVFDVLLLAGTGVLANWTRHGTVNFGGSRGLVLLLAVVIGVFVFRMVRLHAPEALTRPLVQARRSVYAVTLLFIILLTIGYLTKTVDEVSRIWGGLWLVGASLTFVGTRPWITILYRHLETSRLWLRRYAVVGMVGELGRLDRFIHRWRESMPATEVIEGVFLDKPDATIPITLDWKGLVKGSLDDFMNWSGANEIESVIAIMPALDSRAIAPQIEKLRALAIDVDIVTGDVDPVWANRPIEKVAGLPAIRIVTRPLDMIDVVTKRIEDIVIATGALILLSPVMLLVALAIKLDSAGPVLFRQARHGFNNKPFEVLKFRSMRHTSKAPEEVAQARKEDPRVTRVGAFIRRTSIDELPQLFNVLRGDMSIVGPRPHAVQHNDHFSKLIQSYLARHRVKPGITGWAQAHGLRGETETVDKMRQRVEYDLFYVDHWSLGLDIIIIIKTIRSLFHPNAY